MKRIFTIPIIFAALFLSGSVRNNELYAQQIASEADLQTKLILYYDPVNPPNPETARKIRDEIVRYGKDLIDGNYDKYADKIYRGRNRQAVSKSVLDYISIAAAPTKPQLITDGDCAKKNFAACFLSAITAERKNKKPSKQLDVEILLLAMEIARAQIAAEINENLQRDASEYSLELAKRDLRTYYFAGTPTGAARGLGVLLEKIKNK